MTLFIWCGCVYFYSCQNSAKDSGKLFRNEVLHKHVPFIFGLSMTAMEELRFELSGTTPIKYQLNKIKIVSVRNYD